MARTGERIIVLVDDPVAKNGWLKRSREGILCLEEHHLTGVEEKPRVAAIHNAVGSLFRWAGLEEDNKRQQSSP